MVEVKILNRKHAGMIGLIIALMNFILLYSGVAYVLDRTVTTSNLTAYIGFSFLIGLICSLLVYFKCSIALWFFLSGSIIGFFEMYRSFSNGMTGWGDLIGIISLFVWMALGLGIGLLVQLGHYLHGRFQKGKTSV